MPASHSIRTKGRLIFGSVAGRRCTPAFVLFLIFAVLAQTMAPAALAGASPRRAAARSLPRPLHDKRIQPSPRQSPLTSEIRKQIDLHRGTAPASNIPRAAINASTESPARAAFTVSPAVRQLLTSALGLSMGETSRLVGGVYSHYISVPVGAPTALRFGLPSGYSTPTFKDGVLVSDTRTGTLTFFTQTTGGLGASFSLAIPRAATTKLTSSHDVTGAFEIPQLPVLNGTVGLQGSVTYHEGVLHLAATSFDTATTTLATGRVSVSPGLQVSLDSHKGLTVKGQATVGSGAAALQEALTGTVSSAQDWTLSLAPIAHAKPWQPLAGLVVPSSFVGTLTDHTGTIAFDVTSSRPVAWSPVAVAGERVTHFEYSDATPSAGQALPAGYHAGDSWVGTDGQFSAAAGTAGTFQGAGQLAVDLSTSRAVVEAAGSTPLAAGTFAHRAQISGNTMSGALDLRGRTLSGALKVATPHNGTLTLDRGLLIGGLTGPPVPAARVHTSAVNASYGRVPALQRETTNAVSSATGYSPTYIVSSGVYSFLTNALGIPLSSSTLQGSLSGSTLTVALGAPSDLTLPLPTGSAGLAFGATTVSIDEEANTLTLTSAATSGTARLSGTIDNADISTLVGTTDMQATVSATVSVLGESVALTGALTYDGQSVSSSLTGTLANDTTLATDVVLQRGATATLATGTGTGTGTAQGLSITGTVDLGSESNTLAVSVAGTLAGVSNWSLTVSDSGALPWQLETGLDITPDFKGTIEDTNGTVTFDISTTNSASWTFGASGVALNVANLEVSNAAPPSTVSCPSNLQGGQLWVDAQGTATYTQQGSTSPLLSLSGEACLAPDEGTFTLTTQATGNLAPPLGSSVTLTDVALQVSGNPSNNAYSVDGSASLGNVGTSNPLSVGIAFDSDGSFQAGIVVNDLGSLGLGLPSGSGSLWVSTEDVPDFVPSSIPGITDTTPFHLREGLDATLNYQMSQTQSAMVSDLALWGITVPPQMIAVASISTSPPAVTLNLDLPFGTGESGTTIFKDGGAAVYLDDITLGVTLSSDPMLSISGTATLALPAITGYPNSVPSDVSVTLSASFGMVGGKVNVGMALAADCNGQPCPWQNAFGIPGLTISLFAANVGAELGAQPFPLPTLSFSLDGVDLPKVISGPIGLQPGAQISIDADFDEDNPIVHLGLTPPTSGGPALYPLTIVGNATQNPTIDDALAIDTADLWLSPSGGQLAGGQLVKPGVSVAFVAILAGVSADVFATVDPTAGTVEGTASVDSFQLGTGGPTFGPGPGQKAVLFKLTIEPGTFSFEFDGGFSFSGFDFSAAVYLAAVTSFAGASASVSITAGLPQYLQLQGTMSGSFSFDSFGLDLSASGSGSLIIGQVNLGSVSFSYSFSGGMDWAAVEEAPQQIASAFEQTYGWTSGQITQALVGLQYGAIQVAEALNSIGVQGLEIGQDIVQFFTGTSDSTLASYLQQAGLAPVQIGMALHAVFSDADSTVARWLEQVGYNAVQIGETLQYVFDDDEAQIVTIFNNLGETANQIALALRSVFNDADTHVAIVLANLGYTFYQVGQSLVSVFNDADTQVATALSEAGYTVDEIAQTLESEFSDADTAVAIALNDVGYYTADQIVQALQTVFNDADTQVAAALKDLGYTDAQVAAILNSLGYSTDQIAQSLQSAFNDVQYQILNALSEAGISTQTVIDALTSFFTGDGSYTIASPDLQNLDVQNASTSPGAPVIQYFADSGRNQDWFVIPTDSGFSEIVNRNSGQCLSVGDPNPSFIPIVQMPCDGDYGQQWSIGGTIGSRLYLGWDVDVLYASLNPGDPIDLYPSNGQWNQDWWFTQALG